jgi:bifunctional UDP-N-acetylglucosamine pyrophosphorylase/glucosamine-1-phosphate N-acetyltransferase
MALAKKPLAIVILAAGKGTRMKSALPKVLHPLLGKPMLGYVLETAKGLNPSKTFIVIGHQADRVAESFPKWPAVFIRQVPQLGTGHALQVTRKELESFKGTVMVLSGDVPLIEKETLKKLLQVHERSQAVLTLLSTELNNPKGYGRIIRDAQGNLQRIVEEKDAAPRERLIREINCGLYCFKAEFLLSALSGLTRKNRQKEYYLTDLIQIARETSQPMAAFFYPRSEEILGINDRAELARSSQILRQRILHDWMVQGVTILDPVTTYIESSVRLGSDTVIGPFTTLLGKTRIGSHCTIQSHVVIDSRTIKDGTIIPPFTCLQRIQGTKD